MEERLKLSKIDNKAFEAMIGLEKYLASCGIEPKLYELIKTRASQINSCAFCINMHVRDAIKLGESPQRLFLLNAWRESNLFTEKEKAVLELTEAVTLISEKGVTDEIYNNSRKYLNENEFIAVLMTIVTINSWNRLSVTLRTPLD